MLRYGIGVPGLGGVIVTSVVRSLQSSGLICSVALAFGVLEVKE